MGFYQTNLHSSGVLAGINLALTQPSNDKFRERNIPWSEDNNGSQREKKEKSVEIF